MSFANIYDIAGSSMAAQTTRLNTIASNLANVDSAAASAEEAYKSIKPIFEAVYHGTGVDANPAASVAVTNLTTTLDNADMRFEPNHPLADADGYVAYSNVDPIVEVADMMSATQNFEASVNVMNRARSMQQSLLNLGT
ncbi:flagellar basal body rod protein FlgC [Ferrimonas lipolytica]|uniref:Flagellar basal-body rod protein FlgC n=1 Tax=Ferrimonas lipolytica TaxID=2724191 RepID=A0A6H1UDT6_9GAMM|nr:flagellar basal body rod protein FlgC [Ferrimonas lipolytica]QIZ76789.1 flagellar basal body rod protein FlgC [Ferrimonas lipolytica]